VGDFNFTARGGTIRTLYCFSILNGSWVTSTVDQRLKELVDHCFSILNGSWVTSTQGERDTLEPISQFQYPQRIVGDFN